MVTTFGGYAVLALLRHADFYTAGFDLGIFDQAVRGYAHLQAPVASLKGAHANLLGNHFHPILAVLAPLYWIHDDPTTLLLAQAALVASSVVPVHRMARARLDPWSAWLVTFGYAFGWPVQTLVAVNFHEVAFALPLLAWAVYLVDRERYVASVAVAAGLLLVREDMGLLLVAFAVVLLLKRRWLLAIVAAVAGLGAYYVVTAVIIPALGPGFTYWSYDALGRDLPSALAFVAHHPRATARLFVAGPKGRTLRLLVAHTGVLGVLSPYALLAVPLLAERFFSSRPNLWVTGYHYDALPGLVLVLALVDVLRRLPVLVTRVVAALLAVVVLAGSFAQPELYPLATTARLLRERRSGHVADARAAVAAVPHGVCVEADDRVAAHLTARDDVTLPGRSGGTAAWLVLDLSQRDAGGTPPISPRGVRLAVALAGWQLVDVYGTFEVWRRPGVAPATCF